MSTIKETTTVTETDIDIDSWLGTPGAESIITPTEGESKPKAQPKAEKPNMFSRNQTDMSFLDEEDEDEVDEKKAASSTPTEDINEIVGELDAEADTEATSKGGRPKTDKSGLVGFLKKRIEAGEMVAFDDFDEETGNLEEYLGTMTEKDIEELWTANMDNIKQEVATNTPKEFFESLPEELQFAAKYVLDGGQDLKGLFQALATVEQTRALDPKDESDQEHIVRNYLKATNFGDDEEIDEEITTWKDLGALAKKANQFKPKLDAMQEEQVQATLAEQEQRKAQQKEAADTYVKNVFESLRGGDINGLKLDKKVQAQLYNGLIQAQYQSISGKPTNQLGHLLEKYQFVEPNYPLIAEALWLLSNPEEYRNNISAKGKNTAVEDVARKLKTAQARKSGSSTQDEPEQKITSKRSVPRPTNIFRRS